MLTATNKRDLFYDVIFDGLTASGGFTTANISTTLDNTIKSDYELFISIEDDYLIDKMNDEAYGSGFETRGCNFSIIIRSKVGKSKSVMETARNIMNPLLDKIERLIRAISYNNYQIVVATVIQYNVSVQDLQIKTSAYILDELSEGIIDGTIFYEYSK